MASFKLNATSATDTSSGSPPGSGNWTPSGVTGGSAGLSGSGMTAATNWIDFGFAQSLPNYIPTVPSDAVNIIVSAFYTRQNTGGTGTVKDAGVYLTLSGSTISSDDSDGDSWPGTAMQVQHDFTSALSPADINSGNFGMRLAAQVTDSATTAAAIAGMYVVVSWNLPGDCGGPGSTSDDGYGADSGGTFDNTGDFMRAGLSSGIHYGAFARLSDINVPPGDAITNAYIHAYDHGGGATSLQIGIVNSLSPSAPANAAAVWTDIGSNLTATQVAWSVGSSSFSNGPYPIITSPDIGAIVQEYVDQVGYTGSSNHLLLYIYGDGSSTDVHDFGTEEAGEFLHLVVTFASGITYTLSTGTVYQLLIAGGW